ncbi:MAG: DegT/DnrJ/EryC1/StrS family aminotransferase [Candidatus Omnitrophica bacterium]|nr:DegT/DnrJ/EryC1/StrS family aminotransferase [Candidatus Omnitrophota bacterium]
MTKVPFIDFKVTYNEIREDLLKAATEALDSNQYILGPAVERLEKEVASYLNSKFCVGVASGSDALYLSLLALGAGPGDEVITTAFSFYATAGSITRTGAKPVFVDIEPDLFNLNLTQVKERLNGRTRAVVPVHLFGNPCDMGALRDICAPAGVRIVEDTAQAFGATWRGKQVGTFGDAGCFSFFPTKNLGGFGDGGMVATDQEAVYAKLRALRAHGSRKKYIHEEFGVNSRLDAFQATLLSVKLKHIDRWNDQRRAIAEIYRDILHNVPGVVIPTESPEARHVYHLYSIRTSRQDALQAHLKSAQIDSAVYYPLALPFQPNLADLNYQKGGFPVSERMCSEILSLPLFPGLDRDRAVRVAECVRDFMTHGA